MIFLLIKSKSKHFENTKEGFKTIYQIDSIFFHCFRTSDIKPVDDAKPVPDIIRPDSVPLTRPTSRQRKVPISRPGSRSGSKAGSRPSSRGSMKNGHLDEVQEDGWEWEYYYEEDEEEEGKQIDDCNLKFYNN